MTTLALVLVAVAGYAAFIVALLAFVSVCKKESSRPCGFVGEVRRTQTKRQEVMQ